MDVYNPEKRCPKCGSKQIATLYQRIPPKGVTVNDPPEYMRRECIRCNYVWFETPLNYTNPFDYTNPFELHSSHVI